MEEVGGNYITNFQELGQKAAFSVSSFSTITKQTMIGFVSAGRAAVLCAVCMMINISLTPYCLCFSVKKGLQGEVRSACAGSRKRPGIKDLKFLTPVRRSSRIHRNSTRLPAMVLDHDPCVTSLAELVGLDGDDDANAYIYRKNPALPKDSPEKELLNDSKYF